MIPSLTRLTLGLTLLAGGTVAATVASPPSPTAAAAPWITVLPITSVDTPGVQIVGYLFPPGSTVSIDRYDSSTHSYVPLGTAKVASTGFLAGTFMFNKALSCNEVSYIDNQQGGAYLLVKATTFSGSSSHLIYTQVDAPGPVEDTSGSGAQRCTVVGTVRKVGDAAARWIRRHVYGKRVLIATDADEAGDLAAVALTLELSSFGRTVRRLRPRDGIKDWNEALMKHGAADLSLDLEWMTL